jgi:hypothetical protein
MNFSTAEFCLNSNESGLNYLRTCYPYFASNDLTSTILEICLGVSTAFFNILVIKMIQDKKEKKVVFDDILMTHAIVDGVVGGIDLPFFHIFTIIGKWPFGKVPCILWNSLDSSINAISMFHMLYMSWVRLMSILQPQTYLQNRIVKYPLRISLLCWLTGFLIWTPVNIGYITNNYPEGQCYIPFQPAYIKLILTFLTWFVPLIIIACMLLYFLRILHVKQNRVLPSNASNTNFSIQSSTNTQPKPKISRRKFKLSPATKLTIIVFCYLLQWIPSCLIWMIDSLCNCVPLGIATFSYWLTFTVSLTDPILILVLNTNFRKKN